MLFGLHTRQDALETRNHWRLTAAVLPALIVGLAFAAPKAAVADFQIQKFEFKPWQRNVEPNSLGLPWTDGSDQFFFDDGSTPFTYYGVLSVDRSYDPAFGWDTEGFIWDFDLDVFLPHARAFLFLTQSHWGFR